MLNYKIKTTKRFEKDAVRCIKRGLDISLLENFVKLLENNEPIPQIYKAHLLKGNYTGHKECHIKPDWLLIWITNETDKTVTLVRTGTHSDLF